LETLRQEVWEANQEVCRRGLAMDTFGNASGIAREQGLVVVKPSGVPYATMTAQDMVITNLEGAVVEGSLRPSTDLPTHLALYRAFAGIGGVVHTHSHFATAWAQAQQEIPCFGTTHADYFRGAIPVTEMITNRQIESEYETNIGHVIVQRFNRSNPLERPAVLVPGHGPFCWGATATEAAHNAVLLEEIARLAYHTLLLNPLARPLHAPLLDKHFLRKHGPGAYYGQS